MAIPSFTGRILHTPLPQLGHGIQQNVIIYDVISENEESETDSTPILNDDFIDCHHIPVINLKKILLQALSWFFIHKSLTGICESAHIQLDHMPFMLAASSDLFNSILFTANEDVSDDEIRLDQLLRSWHQSRQKIPRDGNCLFFSVAHNLKLQIERGNSELEQILANVGIHVYDSVTQMACSLRKGVVKEWLGEHSKDYEIFLSAGQLHSQAEEFLQDGVYSSDVGDLAIAALSNVLQIPLVVFTSRPHQPLHVQHPTHYPMVYPHPVHLAYLHLGPGHYDAVIPDDADKNEGMASTTVTSSASSTQCNYGRKSTARNSCSFSLMHYKCRCPCYNSKQPCTNYCKCKGCTNTFGVKPAIETVKAGQKRKRTAHDGQAIPLKGKKTICFMENQFQSVD